VDTTSVPTAPTPADPTKKRGGRGVSEAIAAPVTRRTTRNRAQ
jgi:hypothetical protein